jgi:hypothetical protein
VRRPLSRASQEDDLARRAVRRKREIVDAVSREIAQRDEALHVHSGWLEIRCTRPDRPLQRRFAEEVQPFGHLDKEFVT